jgi:hypothetical protein
MDGPVLGRLIKELAHALFPFIKKRAKVRRTIHEVFYEQSWIQEIIGGEEDNT